MPPFIPWAPGSVSACRASRAEPFARRLTTRRGRRGDPLAAPDSPAARRRRPPPRRLPPAHDGADHAIATIVAANHVHDGVDEVAHWSLPCALRHTLREQTETKQLTILYRTRAATGQKTRSPPNLKHIPGLDHRQAREDCKSRRAHSGRPVPATLAQYDDSSDQRFAEIPKKSTTRPGDRTPRRREIRPPRLETPSRPFQAEREFDRDVRGFPTS